MDELDQIAEQVYDYCCANHKDNKTKNPREIGSKFSDLYPGPKQFYRNVARWHLSKKDPSIANVFDGPEYS